MKHNRPPILVIVIVILAVLVGGYFGIRSLLDQETTALTASGTIEAIEVNIAPEIGGKVAEVLVDEGTPVKIGDVLFRLDDSLLQAQRVVAASSLDLSRGAASTAYAALAVAQANYDLALNTARLESATARTSNWRMINPPGYTLPGGYFSHSDEIAAAQVEVDAALSANEMAQNTLDTLLDDPTNTVFVAAEKRLSNAHAAYLVAQDVLTRAIAGNNTDLGETAQSAYDEAKAELTDAQAAYDDLKESDAAKNITTARLDLAIAREQADSARDRLLVLQTGEDSPKVAAAQAVLHQAQAAADQAILAVAQSEASLALIDTQVTKLTIISPADGIILTSSIQPGEIVAPGAIAMTLGRLEDLTIIVYVPENLYGEIFLGQSASMTVDSFPNETFIATVIHIADQAEFTPRNIQTTEGRSSTVFAIKLQVQDPSGKLRPGMPADVVFGK